MSERGSYTDQWERRDELDPRDLVPVRSVGLSPRAVVYDLDELRQILGDMEVNNNQIKNDVYKAV